MPILHSKQKDKKSEIIIQKVLNSTYSLPDNNFLEWSQLKAFAEKNIKVTEKLKTVLEKVENFLGTGENASYQHFLLFPQCLKKASVQ